MVVRNKRYETMTIKVPASLEEVVDVIGETLTMRLVEAYRGTTQRLPAIRNATDDHEIAKLIGKEKLHQLVSVLGASRHVYIPRCMDGLRQNRDREIVRRYSEGDAVEKLALEFDLSDRQVWNILKKTEMDDGQDDLF